jgi:hypothetical protein
MLSTQLRMVRLRGYRGLAMGALTLISVVSDQGAQLVLLLTMVISTIFKMPSRFFSARSSVQRLMSFPEK